MMRRNILSYIVSFVLVVSIIKTTSQILRVRNNTVQIKSIMSKIETKQSDITRLKNAIQNVDSHPTFDNSQYESTSSDTSGAVIINKDNTESVSNIELWLQFLHL